MAPSAVLFCCCYRNNSRLFVFAELCLPTYQRVVGEPERVTRLVGVDIERAGNAPKLIHDSNVGGTHGL